MSNRIREAVAKTGTMGLKALPLFLFVLVLVSGFSTTAQAQVAEWDIDVTWNPPHAGDVNPIPASSPDYSYTNDGSSSYKMDVSAGVTNVRFRAISKPGWEIWYVNIEAGSREFEFPASTHLSYFEFDVPESEAADDQNRTVTVHVQYRQGGASATLAVDLQSTDGAFPDGPPGAGWDYVQRPASYDFFVGPPYGGTTDFGPIDVPFGVYEVDGRAVAGWTYTVTPSSANLDTPGEAVTFVILYSRNTFSYNAVVNPGAGGSVTSTNPVTGLVPGDDPTFDITVNSGYEVASISFTNAPSVSGISVGNGPGNYTATVNNVTAAGTLTVNLRRQTGSLTVQTELAGGGTLPTGSGWDLTTTPGDFAGTPTGKDTGGLTSINSQGVSPAVTGSYAITGRAVPNYTISYGPNSGSLTAGGSLTLKVIYTRQTGSLNVITELAGGGTLPSGSGWDLTTTPGDFSGTPTGKDTGGLGSGDDQSVSPAVTGNYAVTGRSVSGYSISYGPQNGTLSSAGSLTLKVIYTRQTGTLTVETELAGGGTLPSGSGWDLTTTPGDFSGTPTGKDTSGLTSINSQGVSPAVTGNYAVTGRAVSGYSISYGPQNGSLTSGGSLTLKVIYTRQTGELTVQTELTGGGNLPTGSGWDLTTTPAGFAGTPSGKDTSGLASVNSQGVSPAITGTYEVTGRAVSGYTISYGPQNGSLTSGGSLTLKVIYTRDTGRLNVITELTGGGTLPGGSGWDLTTTPSDFSGTPSGKDTSGLGSGNDQGVSPAVTGNYAVTGRAVGGYSISYGPQNGSLAKDGTLTLKVIYTRQTGTLTVQTELTGGGTLPAGSGWDITTAPGGFAGTPTGKDTSGLASVNSQGVAPAITGTYAVTGRAVGGYSISYGPQNGSLTSGGSLTLKVIYTRQTGELTVQTELTGGGNLPTGSGWDLTTKPGDFGGSPSGKNTSGLASVDSQGVSPAVTGSYGVTGRAVSGYTISYSPQSGSLTNGGSLTLKVIYTRDTGRLNVITELTGGGTLPGGSGWDLTTAPGDFAGSPSGKNTSALPSGDNQVITPAVTGTYGVTGRAVSGYTITYAGQSGTLLKDAALTLKVIYTRQTGTLTVQTELTGGGVLPAGSGWDLTTTPGDFGGSPSGKNTSGLPSVNSQGVSPAVTGSYAVTGRAVGGFTISYGPQSGSLSSGGSLTLKVIYTRDTGSLNVITEKTGGGLLPTGSGWDLTTKPGDFTGTPAGKNTSGLGSGDNQPVSPAVTGSYGVTGRVVTGYTISYGPQSGSLSKGGSLTLKVIYTRDTGSLTIQTELTGGGNLPTGSGWDLTPPSDYTGAVGKNTSGLPSVDSQVQNPAVTGSYNVTGRVVSGFTISYSPQNGTLTKDGSLTLKVIYTRDTGRLNVITELTGGGNLPTGSGWDLTTKPGDFGGSPSGKDTGGLPSGDDQTVTPAVTGNYAVTGRAVTGFTISYSPQNGTLSKDGALTLKVIYGRDTGNLNVITELTGGGNLPTGSGWDLTTKPGDFGGSPNGKDTGGLGSGDDQSVSPAVTGDYAVTGRVVSGYTITYGPQNGSLTKDGSLTLKVIYTRDTGLLRVITQTFDNRNLPVGAGWDLTTKPGDYSGLGSNIYNGGESSPQTHNENNAQTGYYVIDGKAVTGWTFVVSVQKNGPQENVAPSIEDPNGGTLVKDGELIFTITYTINRYEVDAIYWDPIGNVQVPGGTITPPGAVVEHGASQDFAATVLPTNYRLTGGSEFTGASTSTSVNLVSSIATVNGVTSSGTMRIHVEIIPGELEVIILPVEVRPQAAWRMQGAAAWKNSWPHPEGTEELNPGFYDLEFLDVAGWFTPAAVKDVQVFAGQKTTVTVIYTKEESGALQVFIEDNLDERVRELGAQWQPIYPPEWGIPNDPTKWYNHGDIITGLPVGTVGLRFKTLAGWILPELTGAGIVANTTTKETGEYWRVLIIHKSDYNGDGTDDLATFDKSTGKWSIASISKPAQGPAAFDLFEKKFGKKDDFPTSGDYDGDGIADLAYWREQTGEWRVAKQFKLKNFGEEQDIPVPGDYNGDGMTDPALFRPSTGEWMIYDRDLKEIITVTFGAFGDVPVPGNYDADEAGMTDLAIFNVETQKWRVAIYDAKKEKWIEKKTVRVNGKRIKLRVNHGDIGNVPVHADYDGDGATDLAIYKRRPSEWNVRNQFEIQLGDRGDIPVPNDWAGLGRVIPTIFKSQKGRWLSIDNLLNTKHGQGGQPLMSGR